MSFTKDLYNRIQIALTSKSNANELVGLIGLVGGWRCDGTGGGIVAGSATGNSSEVMSFSVAGDATAGVFHINTHGIKWTSVLDIKVSGFVPKNSGANGDGVEVQVTGWNVAHQYITVQVVAKDTPFAVTPTAGMIIGFEAKFVLAKPH